MSDTVISCIKEKDWTGKDGKAVPIYKVELSDNRSGESFGKEIPVGTPVSDIAIEDKGQYGLKFKWNKPTGGGFKGSPKQDATPAFAISYAKDWAIAQLNKGVDVKTDDILKIADKFLGWMDKNKR